MNTASRVQSSRSGPAEDCKTRTARLCYCLEVDTASQAKLLATLPFLKDDATAGVENELQAVVSGRASDVDLPSFIMTSNFYKNTIRRAVAGDVSRRKVVELEKYLEHNTENVWENSWVVFPEKKLDQYVLKVFETDLLRDKRMADSGIRGDAARYRTSKNGEKCLRIPVSYLLKLSLADAVASDEPSIPGFRGFAESAMMHFLNDNTSPETFSFYPARLSSATGMGCAPAEETLLRFLMTQLLTQYANQKFGLMEIGQKVEIYFAPHTPVRQQQLNELIPDSFYREVFMSPCLSGWDKGEEKHQYMTLCHQVLSRSRLNATLKLRDAGIITRDIVVLPNTSNTSLTNNGTHVSLGSMRMTGLLEKECPEFTFADEKYVCDLAIKIMEHFLPLFTGLYSAAPYRLDFNDFHPETCLGFLPHEIDYTHLRMIWRRWKKKAHLRFLGHPLTPFGPRSFDRALAGLLGLTGDLVPDFRLIDYLICPMSSEENPAFDGRLGNQQRLLSDLTQMGVFDEKMSFYSFFRMRDYATRGFTGFEGRYYSIFPEIKRDLAHAVNLQTLVTALAFKYIVTGRYTHEVIPDKPFAESERRQILYGAAIGLPTFFVRPKPDSKLMEDILGLTKNTRMSGRYGGYVRVYQKQYKKALLRILARDAGDLTEQMGIGTTIKDLAERIENSNENTASDFLTKGILKEMGVSCYRKTNAEQFNLGAESYYRNTLRKQHLKEALDVFHDFLGSLQKEQDACPATWKFLSERGINTGFLRDLRRGVLDESLDAGTLRALIAALLCVIRSQALRHIVSRQPCAGKN